jgi:ribosomal protein S18 acetylase RimI-like enzyme
LTPGPAFALIPARGADDLAAVIALFADYAASLDVDLYREGFEDEVAALPGDYAAPAGEILVARGPAGVALGCVALRPLSDGECEIKRLYVRPEGRGGGLGRALMTAIIAAAERRGYAQIKLDTLPSLDAAIALYLALGFRPIPPYAPILYPGQLFFAKALTAAG